MNAVHEKMSIKPEVVTPGEIKQLTGDQIIDATLKVIDNKKR